MHTPVVITDRGCDRATAYHQANKIVRTSRGVFVTWLDSKYRCILTQIDESGKVVMEHVYAQAFDNHCGGALTQTPDGTVHMLSGSHHLAFLYLKSATPWDPTSWSIPEVVGQTATYPSLIHTPDGALHLTHRRAGLAGDEHWGVAWHFKAPGGNWGSYRGLYWRMPTPLYTYPTNALTSAPDGTVHCIIEWYKTWPNNVIEPQSLGISHFELKPGGSTLPKPPTPWHHTDGRPVKSIPIKVEESYPQVVPAGDDPRPGNVAALPNGRPVFGVWHAATGAARLCVQQEDRAWRHIDLNTIASDLGLSGKSYVATPQVAINSRGHVVAVVTRSDENKWGGDASWLHTLVIDPQSGVVIKHAPVPRAEPDQPDWLASIEKPGAGVFPDEFNLIYQTGKRGTGCINEAQCRVRWTRVG